MPVLSRFYGIIIRMYFLQKEHNPPHIHAIYGDDVAAVTIPDGKVIEGALPNKALEMVKEWVSLNWNKEVCSMFHKIKNVSPLTDYRLSVQFAEGCTKIYDVKPLFDAIPAFKELKEPHLFSEVTVDVGGYGIIWNDDLDLSCDELWENGIVTETPFDGLMAFRDATTLWALNEST